MSTAAIGPTGAPALRQQARAYWRSRAPRERLALLVMAVAIGLLVVWNLAVQPAWQTVRSAPAQLDALDAQMQQMQVTATEVRGLRAVAPVSPQQAANALRAATDRLGDRAKLSVQNDRATLTLNGLGTEDLRAWLTEARSAARARPIEGQLQRNGSGYSGTLTLTLGGGT